MVDRGRVAARARQRGGKTALAVRPPAPLSRPTARERQLAAELAATRRRLEAVVAARPPASLAARPPARRPRPRPTARPRPPRPRRPPRSIRLGRSNSRRDQVVASLVALVVAVLVGQGRELPAEAAPADAAAAVTAEVAATPSSASLDRVLAVADSQVGTTEGRGGGTAYHDAYPIADREPWCAVWIWWVFQEAGAADLIHPRTAYTPTLHGWFAERGRADRTPSVGALVFYDWPGDSLDRIQHVGLVVAVEDGAIVTLEGNTGPGAGGNQSDGDGVYRRTRPLDDSIVGYGHPDYANAA